VTVASAADWPQWRGPNRDGKSADTGLLKDWPEGGPKLRWKATDIGTGYSAPSVVGGKVYLQTTRGEEEFALALDEKTGKPVWQTPIGKVGKNNGPQYPGTRSTPTADGDRLYCLASDGTLVCLTTDGKAKWTKSLPGDLGGKVGNWAYAESVLVDGDVVVCTPGGKEAGLAALNKMTGEVVWKATLPGGGVADYASIMPVEAGGSKQYVQFMRNGVFGVDARTGKYLWRYDRTVQKGANILTPVVSGNRVFTAGSQGAGTVEVVTAGDKVEAKEVYFDRALGAGIGGAVLVDGHLYGTTPNELFCADFATGKVKWSAQSVRAASICYADGRLYVRGHGGEVALVEATPEEYREKGRFQQPDRSERPAWPHPVVANGGFYLRDQGVLLCYDVAADKK
jgi:outer membrane protein assembly factor BamB